VLKNLLGFNLQLKLHNFIKFHHDFLYLDMRELIEYFSVFEGFTKLHLLRLNEDFYENILENIIKKYHTLKDEFILHPDENMQLDLEKVLFRLAIGDRKIYSIYKNDISQPKGRELYKILFDKNIITKEHSREKILAKTSPSTYTKKEFRGYQIEDKIKFHNEFTRFWFTFIAPQKELILEQKHDELLEIIKKHLDQHTSLTFEDLANELIKHEFNEYKKIGSYWDKDIELDVFATLKNGQVIIGECKWTNHKISKNILNKLIKKSQKGMFQANYYALFSKSGFSKELEKKEDKRVLLYDLKSFEKLFT
jgi:hypothetical protein